MKKALKYVLFVLTSTLFSFSIAYLYFYEKDLPFVHSLGAVAIVTMLAPLAGFITGTIFLITNRFLLKKNQNKKKFYFIRILVFILIYALVCSVMLFG